MSNEIINLAVNEIHERDGWRCQFEGCNKRSEEVAHRISKSKANKKVIEKRLRYLGLSEIIKIDEVINNPLNLVASCKQHNSYFNIGNRPLPAARLINMIIKELLK